MQNLSMHLILAIGATPAQAHTVWLWLQQQGVLPARASRREQLLPEALSELMAKTERKGAGLAAANHLQHKLWAELATDLLLANVEQQRWGWVQPLAGAHIDFWLDFDPSVQLVLGYVSPLAELRLLLQSDTLPCHEQVDATLRQWQQHSSELLACHYRHRQRSVLINTEAVTTCPKAHHAAAVAEALGLEWPEHDGGSTSGDSGMASATHLDGQLEAFLLNEMLARSPSAAALFQELEAASHWPAPTPVEPPEPPNLAALWQLQRQRATEHKHERRLLEAAVEQMSAAAQHKDYLFQQQSLGLAQLNQELEQEAQAHATAQIDRAALQSENELLLAQLHQVQEELEKLFIQRAELEKAHKAEQADRAQEQTAVAQKFKAAEQALASERGSLSQRLVAAEALLPKAQAETQSQQQQNNDLAAENVLLLTQLHQVQEELENLFKQRAELEKAHKAEQADLAREQADTAQKLKADERALASERSSLIQRLETAEALLPKAQAETQAQQQQIKEISEENELLLTQLHHVQEDLEHYFLQLKQARQTHQTELAPLAFECAFWHRHSPAEVWVDLRQDVVGQGWYEAEADGRWTGPELVSTLRLPPLAPGRYTVELHLADAIQPELVSGLVVEALRDDGSAIQAIELLHEFGAGASLYPMVSLGELTLPAMEAPWSLRLTLPFNQSPAEQGGSDSRRLGLRLQGLRLSATDAEPEPMHYVDADAADTAVLASANEP